MARKATRGEWTAGDIRDLKSLAKKKIPAGTRRFESSILRSRN